MSGLGVNTQVATAQVDDMDLKRFKAEMAGLKEQLGSKTNREAKLRKACQNFEAVFITKLWQQMKQTVPKDSGMHGSKQEEMYLSMFDRDFSEEMAKGGGIGLADMLYTQLSQKLKDSSRDTLTGTVKPFNDPQQSIPLKRAGMEMQPADRPEPTLEQWTGQEPTPAPSPEQIVSGLLGRDPASMSEDEVELRLDALTRRLESQLHSEEPANNSKARAYGEDHPGPVGRNIAKIG